ncbi:MAG: amidohydrolase family protein [Ilumatobacteraceae bacterium]|nr:amidohydrolase family protein [Ilumatobacteraceae bacterium]
MTTTLLRGGIVVDGTGSPPRRADVVIDGDVIARVDDDIDGSFDRTIDVTGLVVSPGFIDLHTHYDAQVLWDPDMTPSSWHGVTTVVAGNCGFGIAPVRPDDRSAIVNTLETVEGMSRTALTEGITWEFETFPEYLDAVRRRSLRSNMAFFIGHTPLRIYVMGDDAFERKATSDEIAEMVGHVRDAMANGAVGFATSASPTHVGDRGRPVPSRLAGADEIEQIVAEVGRWGGLLQATAGPGLSPTDFSRLSVAHGVKITWAAALVGQESFLADIAGMQELRRPAIEVVEAQAALPGNVWPQVTPRPVTFQMMLDVPPGSLASLPAFHDIFEVPRAERLDVYRTTEWRDRARPQVLEAWRHRWSRITVAESTADSSAVGRTLEDLAAARDTTPFDVMVDLAVGGTTRYREVLLNDDPEQVVRLLEHESTTLGLSDAGAHASQLCDACLPTDLIARWVRDRAAFSLEHAIHMLTGQPAEIVGLADRGTIVAGHKADLVVFDLDTIDTQPEQRWFDLPGDEDRVVVESVGFVHVWVNGTQVRQDGIELLVTEAAGRIVGGTRLGRSDG